MAKKVLFISASEFPANSAMSVRQFYIAKIFKELGYEVLVLSRGKVNNKKIMDFNGVSYLSVSKNNNRIDKFLSRTIYMYLELVNILRNNDFDIVHLAGSSTAILKYLIKYKKRNSKIILTHDSVEWYSPEQFKLGVLSSTYRKKEYWMNKGLIGNFNIISISSYLQNYFESKYINVVKIPVVMDVDSIAYDLNSNKVKRHIIYAGSPGKKDYLNEIVDAVLLLESKQSQMIEISIIGITKEELVKECSINLKKINQVKDVVKCIGRIKREEVLKELKEADFTILIRPENARYAKAGFPTKVVESLTSGTPVITNITSDLGSYLFDGYNSIIVKDENAVSIRDAIVKAIDIDNDKLKLMKCNARKTSIENFDYHLYVDKLSDFLANAK